MLKFYLRKFFARGFYPTESLNWYKSKGYMGEDLQQQFNDFLKKQNHEESRYFSEFQSISLSRSFIPSGEYGLDSVLVTPDAAIARGKPGEGVYFVLFQGRGEYYESRFRDMARQACATGASIIGFNPKGFHSSTGETNKLSDLVDDGIAVINYLLKKNIDYRNIVLQGNSLGAGIQEMVSEYFKLNHGMFFRQINSNSFKNLASVIANHYKVPFLENFFKILLNYSGWEIKAGVDFYKTGPYKMYLRRKGDRTIKGRAQFHFMVDPEADYASSPKGYKETNKWLNENSTIIYNGKKQRDPHELGLSLFKIDEEEQRSVFYMINKFLEESKKYI
jgi:hypothetical protein